MSGRGLRVSRNSLEDVLSKFLEGIRRMSEKCLEGIWIVSEGSR